MYLHQYLDGNDLLRCVTDGTIREAKHESLPLTLYTYTERAQFAGVWTDAQRKCRGLVVEDTGQIIAFCMPKFFNYPEHANGKSYASPLPARESFEIFGKMDGSMGTVFFYEDQWHVASKGSFHSDQAKWATSRLRYLLQGYSTGLSEPLHANLDPLNRHKTYVCEIIYPSNRIVVDYGPLEDLVLLTAYDNDTGREELTEEHRLEWGWIGSVVPSYDPYGLEVYELQYLADENVQLSDDGDRSVSGSDSEGYVVRYESGVRCKIKLSDYLRLHKILTGCSERTIWEKLRDGESLDTWLADVPDEFHEWVQNVAERIGNEVTEYVREAFKQYEELQNKAESLSVTNKKEYFYHIEGSEWQQELLLIQDLKLAKLHKKAWDKAKPAAVKPFKEADV